MCADIALSKEFLKRMQVQSGYDASSPAANEHHLKVGFFNFQLSSIKLSWTRVILSSVRKSVSTDDISLGDYIDLGFTPGLIQLKTQFRRS